MGMLGTGFAYAQTRQQNGPIRPEPLNSSPLRADTSGSYAPDRSTGPGGSANPYQPYYSTPLSVSPLLTPQPIDAAPLVGGQGPSSLNPYFGSSLPSGGAGGLGSSELNILRYTSLPLPYRATLLTGSNSTISDFERAQLYRHGAGGSTQDIKNSRIYSLIGAERYSDTAARVPYGYDQSTGRTMQQRPINSALFSDYSRMSSAQRQEQQSGTRNQLMKPVEQLDAKQSRNDARQLSRRLAPPWERDKEASESPARKEPQLLRSTAEPEQSGQPADATELSLFGGGRFDQMRRQVGDEGVPWIDVSGPVTEVRPKRDVNAAPIEWITTFVGESSSAVNERMERAEKLLKQGQYYEAANEYELARTLEPNNPLPLLGRSMAFLGAGEYMTSSINLFQAIEMFEPLAYYEIDLRAFIPDLRILDRRRAELESMLERHENYRLRFLLGFAEYGSDLQSYGLANMEKSVETAPARFDSARRFVAVLKLRREAGTATQPAHP